VFRASAAGLGEERLYSFDNPPEIPVGILPFPDGNSVLVPTVKSGDEKIHLHKVNADAHGAVEVASFISRYQNEVGSYIPDLGWGEPGKNVVFSRNVNGLTNLWSYSLEDKGLTQLTFGPGPDLQPMLYPAGKAILFVNGRGSGFLTVYRPKTKTSVDIVSEDATQPDVSPDGKRVMFLKILQDNFELWVSDMDGSNARKLSSAQRLTTLAWSRDGSQLSFADNSMGGEGKTFLVGADGRGLHQLEHIDGFVGWLSWSADSKKLYVSATTSDGKQAVWTADADGSHLTRLLDDCCQVADVSADGKRLLGLVLTGEHPGIYQITESDKKISPLVPGAAPFGAHYAPDGKSVVYPVGSGGEVTFYRQAIDGEKAVGKPQIALKLPFTFPLSYNGNAFDFSPDLSAIVYARPGGQADFYQLTPSQ
jgi:dipeptidyl aminopeptidase/acylaminoacyl peptidase